MSRKPETNQGLVRKLRQRDRQAGRAQNASPYTRSGTSVTAENEVTVAGHLQSWDFDGDGGRVDLGATGWMLGPNDGGPSLLALNGVDVYANLAAKDVVILGLIDDLATAQEALTAQNVQILALLSNVIVPAFGYDNGASYAIPAGQANRITRASFTLTVPSGFTQALISATAQDTGNNSTAGYDYLNSYINISTPGKTTYHGDAPSATAPAGYSTESNTHMTTLYTGLSAGAVITVASQPYSYTGAWASSSGNGTGIDATCLFLR